MTWLLLALFSSVTTAITRILQKKLLDKEQSDPFAFGFVFQTSVAVLFFVSTLLTNSFEIPNLSALVLPLICMALLYSLGNISIFTAFKHAPAVVSLLFKPSSVKNVRYFYKPKIVSKVLACSMLYATSALSIFSAYKMGGPASLISPMQQTSIVFTVLLSYLFLNERDHLPKKIVGAGCMFLGVVLLV